MSDTWALALFAAVAWTGYQVWCLRHEERQRQVDLAQARRRSDLDDELRRLCPNVCTSLTIEDLRVWQAGILRKDKYFRDRINSALLDPISDEPSDWASIYLMYLRISSESEGTDYEFPPQANDEERGFLGSAREATEEFIRKARDQTRLTTAEIHFLTYWEWRGQLMNRDDSWGRPSVLTGQLLKKSFDRTLEDYAKPPALPI